RPTPRCRGRAAPARSRATGSARSAAGARRDQRADLRLRLAEVVLVLEHEGQRLADRRRIQLPHPERAQPARPVQRLRDAPSLAQLEAPQPAPQPPDLRSPPPLAVA